MRVVGKLKHGGSHKRLPLIVCLMVAWAFVGALIAFNPPHTPTAVAQSTDNVLPDHDIMWSTGPVLDQGDTPRCLGFAIEGWLEAMPYPTHSIPADIYHWAQFHDWKKTDDTMGAPLDGGMDFLYRNGFAADQAITQDPAVAVNFMDHNSPLLVASAWYFDMYYPDSAYYVHPTGNFEGYHMYMCNRYTAATKTISCQNSWGDTFGDSGHFNMTTQDFYNLLNNPGESGVFLLVKKNPTPFGLPLTQEWFGSNNSTVR